MRYKQRGASYLGIFAIIIVAAFAIKLTVAIWPAYWDDRVINQQIADLLVTLPKDTSQTKFKDELRKRLEMNSIRDLKVDDILKANNTSGLAVQKDYEVRKPFVSNIELVMTFKKDFDQRSIATQ